MDHYSVNRSTRHTMSILSIWMVMEHRTVIFILINPIQIYQVDRIIIIMQDKNVYEPVLNIINYVVWDRILISIIIQVTNFASLPNDFRIFASFFFRLDAKDLKNLAEKTNLPKRVLQVWFQNARAKYRRSVSRSDTIPSNSQSQSASQSNSSQLNSSQSLTISNMIDIRPAREDTTNSSNLSSPTESIRSKTSSVNFSESETCGSM